MIGTMILWHVQKEIFPLSLVIGNSEVATKIWAGAIVIEGLDAIIEIDCRHYHTLRPVRYPADDLVAKVGALRNLLYVYHDWLGESRVGTRWIAREF